jgi:hypothetical protein
MLFFILLSNYNLDLKLVRIESFLYLFNDSSGIYDWIIYFLTANQIMC